MNRYDYIGQIEKVAADEVTERSLPAKLKDSFVEMKINDVKKNALKYGGTALGTAIAMKRGKPLGTALASGGMAGMATGDIAGSVIFPTADLYRKHKQEFGTAPDMATTGKILAANALPTAGFWGAAYGTKAGIKNRKLIAGGIENGIGTLKSKPAEYQKILSKSESYIPKDVVRDAAGQLVMTPEQNTQMFKNMFPDVAGLVMGEGARDAVGNAFKNPDAQVADGVMAMGRYAGNKIGTGMKAMAVPSAITGAMNIPAAIAAPSNLIEAKKRRMEQGDVNG